MRESGKDRPDSGNVVVGAQSDAIGEDFPSGFVARLGRDAGRYFPAVILPALLSITGMAIFTRVFQPDLYGEYLLVIATATIVIAVIGGWLQQSVIRYLPRYHTPDEQSEFRLKLNTLLGTLVALVAVVFTAGWFVLHGTLGTYERFYFPALALMLTWLTFITYNTVFQASLQSGAYARYQMAYATLRLLISLALIFLISRNVVWLVVGMAAAYAVVILPMMKELGLFRGSFPPRPYFDRPLFRSFASYGAPIVGWALAIKLLDISDRYIIAIYKGPDEVGIYAANYNLAVMVMGFVASPLLLAAHPLIVSAWEQGGRTQAQKTIRSFSRYFLIISLPVCLFVGVFSREITGVVFGEAFREGYVVIPVVLAGLLLWNFGMYGHKAFKLIERTSLMLVLVIICTVVNVGLNFLLVPSRGYFGAAVATMISYALYPVLVFVVSRRNVEWLIPWRSAVNVVAASLVAAAFWLLTDVRISTNVFDDVLFAGVGVVGLILYLAVLTVLGESRDYETRYVRRILMRIRGKR